jgi:hypothetical protein
MYTAITVQNIYDAALKVMDEDTDSAYISRTPALVNTLIAELYPYTEDYDGSDRNGWTEVSAMTDEVVDFDKTLLLGVMPYGLGALLLVSENPTQANFCLQKYQEGIAQYQQSKPATISSVSDVYGLAYDAANADFGRWD